MKEQHYQQLQEHVLTETLDNGLKVVMIPKENYHKTFAVLTTPFGSLDRHFKINNSEVIDIPSGTAHFLEHKLFEKESEDAFKRFGELGADANAFTTAYQTSYLFSTTDHFELSLVHLLDFVQTPYFSLQTIAKEQGIIGQEIQMYEDDPNWIVYMGLLQILYPKSPLADDIAGTQKTISKITPQLLYNIHKAFYQPKQLTLQIVGHFEPKTVLALIRDNQAQKSIEDIQVDSIADQLETPTKVTEIKHFNVVRPKIALGIRLENTNLKSMDGTKAGLIADILADMMFGEQTDWYQNLYNKGIIDTEFETSFDIIRDYQFVSFFSETTEYEALTAAIQNQIENYKAILSGQESMFESLKRATLGEGIQRLNSLESIALRGDDVLFNHNLFDKIMLLQALTYTDILDFANKIYQNVTLQRFILQK
ncbi:EF-P 5-aminopentanol modification-associated protein YfmH [Leuconostoc citreum]|uniref:EF-P 5-aminopentanol modification-associated protein YfmH n=1 Tax=Leuconostoc citreum TaxID=33964 RepID=UPI0002465F99|nr:pitrilysin family protein [Leuconostoc citreum]MCS8588053.1 insulinase family protein [Leuconostoc citreum]MCS8599792.1 insulinase family protein [Leuconostoc citreum]MDY5162781.1 pitrilysin family protein [Leuconostoc citreum]MDY5166336.1 pitrilysin family protein [Leuconostoc citreum]CCF24818.1 YmfH [Leuconostoc citreum LBAE C10]